ncbi:MAG: hypothetical protein AAGD96_17925 [Chloroflexota bacterium]
MKTTILPPKEFDTGTRTAAAEVLAEMQAIMAEAKQVGLFISHAIDDAKSVEDVEAAESAMQTLHDIAAMLFVQWQAAVQRRENTRTLAYARLINGITHRARHLNEKFRVVDTSHLDQMEAELSSQVCFKNFDPQCIAKIMNRAAEAHTHEKAWIWTVLPTFAKQPYGRILLKKVDIHSIGQPMFVTQPFFLSGRSTLFHTHGQNWAFSRPLGGCSSGNMHLNTLWMPSCAEKAFPLDQIDNSEYCNKTVVVVPPKMIHGIARCRCCDETYPTLAELQADDALKQHWIGRTRFGEQACMHIYCPHPPLVKELEQSPFVQEDERFFIEYDMIVFDHLQKTIWSGGGGSWPLRMIKYGTTGTHCGICFEDDPRKEDLDPCEVAKWFVQDPPPPLIRYEFLQNRD